MRFAEGRQLIAAAFGASALACAAWTVWAGKDLSWDLLHYHFYDAHALLHWRMGQDYFAASTQSYLNPFGYLPFYLLVAAGWHSVLVSALLAAIHGANLGFLFLIGRTIFSHRPPRERNLAALLAAGLGGATAVFWATVGTSFLDPLLAVPMLAAVWLLLDASEGKPVSRAGWAGILFGVAAALKYSNAFFALAGLLLAATVPIDRRLRARAIGAYVGGGAISVLLLAGPWMAAMYREFGNPVFPHLNALFRSPAFPPFNLAASRYAPQTLPDALAFPFQLASHSSMTYVEISAPDFRFAAVLACAIALLLAWLLRRGRPAPGSALRDADLGLLAFFGLATVLWIGTSANGRYGMLVVLLVGPCLARLLERSLPFGTASLVTLALVGMQIFALASVSTARWFIAEPWSRDWFQFAVPERARSMPWFYLTVEAQAMGAVVPYLHPKSSFANLRGQLSLAADNRRLDGLLARHEGHVRVLGRALRPGPNGAPRPDVIELYDDTLLRFGLRIDPGDCFAIGWRGDTEDGLSRIANLVSMQTGSRERVLSMGSCALRKAARDPADVAAERSMSQVFDRIERSCQRLFRGQTSVTERLGKEWARDYVGLEARMETHSGYVVLVPYFKLRYVNLGLLADWERQAARPAPCRDPG